jgi:hypothetical protein
MSDMLLQKLAGPVRGRPFEKGRPGGPPSEDQNTLRGRAPGARHNDADCRTCLRQPGRFAPSPCFNTN